MKLRDYLNNKKGRSKRLIEGLGISRVSLWQWKNEHVKISIERCLEIEKFTAGKVTCEELRPELDWVLIKNDYATDI
ncbi:transcriptional regulator [Taylorella asinigenitalis]|uniref:Putative phage protein n=1 Tax=Taylorella asinigenitalis (strain MCE3) TaxID=1008459 RepID=G4QCS2_TAYAM|nr:YdaS family helix-turn-helix protein [Taylorella asinigenitalis]AEP36202.1 putative phage protein [Taylorella asinigenitalis MCE3]